VLVSDEHFCVGLREDYKIVCVVCASLREFSYLCSVKLKTMKKDTLQLVIVVALLAAVVVAVIKFMPHDVLTIYNWYKDNLTYGTIVLLMAIESSFIPFPSEVVVPPAAYFAARNGDMNIAMIVLMATLGALIGAVINYVLALLIGRPVVYSFANSRIGHLCLIDAEKVEKAEVYFDKHGAISTFLGRLIPAIRQLISIPAGLARMNFGTFALFTVLGAGIWNTVLAGLGYWLSTKFPEDQLMAQIEHYNHYLTLAGGALLALIVLFLAYQAFKKHPAKKAE